MYIMLSRILKSIVVVGFFLSCGNVDNQDNYKILKIDVENTDEQIKLSQISENTEIIKLYADSSYLIGDILDIDITSQSIYVHTMFKLFVFQRNGSKKYLINSLGDASNEYQEITDFFVDESTNTLYVWDRITRKMILFDCNTGDFISYFKIDIDGSNFIHKNKTFYFYSAGYFAERTKEPRLIVVSDDAKIKNSYLFSELTGVFRLSHNHFLSLNHDTVYFNNAPTGEIYTISEEGCFLKYKLAINNNSLLTEDDYLNMAKKYNPPELFNQLFNGNSIFCTGNISVCDNYLLIKIQNRNKTNLCFYNNKNDNYLISQTKLGLLEDTYLNIPVYFLCLKNNKVVNVFYPNNIDTSKIDMKRLSEKSQDIYNSIKTLTDYENPLLVISDTKDF